MRTGLILGGGGSVGTAYHAGALTALEQDLGWDPREADVIVGTSAGSVVGSLLTAGVAASDLAALVVDAPHAATHPLVRDRRFGTADVPRPHWTAFLRPPRLLSPAFWVEHLARPWGVDPMSVFSAVLADGPVSLQPHVQVLDEFTGGAYEPEKLRIVGVRRRDLRRVVFGVDGPSTTLATAVAASCAVPGYFCPVKIDGDVYFDGGVSSPTNADLLAGDHLDLAIVLSPMSAEMPHHGRGAGAAMRLWAHQRLMAEVGRLEMAGTRVVVLAPGAEVLRYVGNDMLSNEGLVDIARESFLSTGRQIQIPHNARLLDHLGTRHPVPVAA